MTIGDGIVCSNCGTTLVGDFCQGCGQKRFVESDRRFGHLLHQFVASATDLDGRLWRSVRALLFQPGLLSREYIEGRRARWLSPVSLFLAVSVVYFVAPLHGGDLTQQFNHQVSAAVRAKALGPDEKLDDEDLAASGQAHTPMTSPWIDERVRERDAAARAASDGDPFRPSQASGALGLRPGAAGYDYRDYRLAYDAKADDVSKALVILHVPFAALALMLLFARRHRYFAEHFVVALHYFTFAMLALAIVAQFFVLSHHVPPTWAPPNAFFDWLMRTLLPAYAVVALRRAYSVGWIHAVIAAAVMLAVVVGFNLYVYRAVQFIITFALT